MSLRPAATTFIRKVSKWKTKATSWVRTHKLSALVLEEPYKKLPDPPDIPQLIEEDPSDPLSCIYAQLEQDDEFVYEMSGEVFTAYKRVDQKVKPIPGVFPEAARVI